MPNSLTLFNILFFFFRKEGQLSKEDNFAKKDHLMLHKLNKMFERQINEKIWGWD